MIGENSKNFFEFQIFKKFPEIICRISTKKIGHLKSFKDLKISPNFEKILEKLNPDFDFTFFEQVHRSKIAVVRTKDSKKILAGLDGGVTNLKNLFLGVFIADCFPILVYDPIKKVIGIAHAGWKGVKAEIAQELIAKMVILGATPENIIVGCGPGICVNCYEVGEDVAKKFDPEFLEKRNRKLFLNLEKAIITQLVNRQIRKENIEKAGICVFENNNFFSNRREGKNLGGEQTAFIGMK